ncbi:hypothetical protein ZHAS_00009456 [Anopheles sinensis]|uniref:Uncharacterized protein n=1 Tax=Anopheles sinensis TaxID=74873 RepID=A0A084VV06_ANOSI|nr:hypothetical protein ZHAS_00009456 [Anopheles sinensis]
MDSLTLLNAKYRHKPDSAGQDSGVPAQLRSCVTTPDNESEDNSSDCCLNVVPPEVQVAPAMHQKPLPSFYIERLLQPATSAAQNAAEESLQRHARDSSIVSPESSPSSHRSSPVSAGQTSPSSEREWSAAMHDQSEPRSTTVFIAWPDGETQGVNFNRLQRELLSHHSLFSYGSWLPERGSASLQELQPHQLNLSLSSIAGAGADRQYFNMQGKSRTRNILQESSEHYLSKTKETFSSLCQLRVRQTISKFLLEC